MQCIDVRRDQLVLALELLADQRLNLGKVDVQHRPLRTFKHDVCALTAQRMQCQRDIRDQGRNLFRQRQLLSAIFVAPPPTPHKTDDLRNIGVPMVNGVEATVKFFLGEAS